LFAVAVFGLLLISNCSSSQDLSETAPNTPSIPSTVTSTLTPTLQGTPAGEGGITVPGLSDLATAIPTMVELIPTRTPAPTATPDAISEVVSQIIQRGGASGKTLFWLKYADWINLGVSLIFVFVGYMIGTWMIGWLLPRLVRRTKTKLDDRLLQISGNQLRWLAVVLIFRSSIDRLTFVGAGIKTFIIDITFYLSLFLVIGILWRLIDLVAQEAEMRARKSGQQREAESLITLSVWVLRFFVFIFLITITLGHFAVNITGIALFLGIVVLVLSIASRDLLADVISGAMILVDRPFRIGDRLELPSIDSWGDVVEIGMRSTKILSMENRMVVLPNSEIGKSQIINYSYPDPSYLDLLNVLVAYDNDVEQVEQLLAEAILSVEGVQKEREIYTLLMELNETHMLFWAGWWVESYMDRYPVHGEVSKAIIKKLKEAGVVLPYRRALLNPKVNPSWDVQTPMDDSE
jgi:small-conductance mechanosensitive channel